MLLYAITSRALLADTEPIRAEKLVALAATWASNGVDFVQIRESDLAADLTRLAAQIVRAVRKSGDRTQVLINAKPETAMAVALESGADGVHLPGGMQPDLLTATIASIRQRWMHTSPQAPQNFPVPAISVSCHSIADVEAARAARATLALFAPVFEKVLPAGLSPLVPALPGQGLTALAKACRAARLPAPHPPLPVVALGGVTLENAAQCLAAGAAGIAAIRLFLNQPGEGPQDWRRLR